MAVAHLPMAAAGAPPLREILIDEGTCGDRPIGGSGASTRMDNAGQEGMRWQAGAGGVMQPAATLLEWRVWSPTAAPFRERRQRVFVARRRHPSMKVEVTGPAISQRSAPGCVNVFTYPMCSAASS